jgi:cyclin H
MDLFAESTHRHWIFSEEELAAVRSKCRDFALGALLTGDRTPRFFACKEAKSGEGVGGLSVPNVTSVADLRSKAPSIEEEEIWKQYQLFKMQQFCVMLKLTKKVMASALVFFKRFYLSNSVLEQDTSKMMLTAIYLSAKIEEEVCDVDFIVRTLELDTNESVERPQAYVLENEMRLLQGINFQLVILHPFRTIKGFVEGWRLYEKQKGDPMEIDGGGKGESLTLNGKVMNQIIDLADKLAVKALVYDTSLIYPPAQIALATLDKAITKTQKNQNANAPLWAQLAEQHGEEKVAQLRMRISTLQQRMEKEEAAEELIIAKVVEGESTDQAFPQIMALSHHLKKQVKWKKKIKKLEKKLKGGGEKKLATAAEGSVVKTEVKAELNSTDSTPPAPKRVKTEKMEI